MERQRIKRTWGVTIAGVCLLIPPSKITGTKALTYAHPAPQSEPDVHIITRL